MGEYTTSSISFLGLNWTVLPPAALDLDETRSYTQSEFVNSAQRFQNLNARVPTVAIASGVSAGSPSCCCSCVYEKLRGVGFEPGDTPGLTPYNPQTNPCGYIGYTIVCNDRFFTSIKTEYPKPLCGSSTTSSTRIFAIDEVVNDRLKCSVILALEYPCDCPKDESTNPIASVAIAEEISVTKKYSDALEFKNRNYIRVGTGPLGTYRGVIFLSPLNQIQSVLTSEGKGASAGYSIKTANLTLTAMSGSANIPVRAFMLPLTANADENVLWQKPSSSGYTYFENLGGDIEPLSEDIVCYGTWTSTDTVSFDITAYMNIWNTQKSDKLGIIIANEESVRGFHTFFYSSESATPLVGGQRLANCKFLGAGASNSVSTEGVRVKFTQNGVNVLLQSVDTSASGSTNWAAFNAGIAVGATFSMLMPDTTNAPSFSEKVKNEGTAMKGYKAYIFTVLNKLSDGGTPTIVVDENTSVFSTDFYTTGEFSCTTLLPTGSGIMEFTEADTKLLLDLSALQKNDPLYVNYTATNSPNNVRSYSVNFYSNETLKSKRVRVYLNEAAVTESRIGAYTEIKSSSVQPTLNMQIQTIAYAEMQNNKAEDIGELTL